MITSLVILTRTTSLDKANALCALMGWRDDNFRAELGATATGETTHLGLRATVGSELVALLEQALQDRPELSSAMILDSRPDNQRHGHFEAVLDEAGLVRIAPPDID